MIFFPFISLAAENNILSECRRLPATSNTVKNFTFYTHVKSILKVDSNSCNDGKSEINIALLLPNQQPSYKIIKDKDVIQISSLIQGSYPVEKLNMLKQMKIVGKENISDFCVSLSTAEGLIDLICKPITINPQEEKKKKETPCYDNSKYSHNIISISGKMMHCLKFNLDQILLGKEGSKIETTSRINSFTKFQISMRKIVAAIMILYIIFFGMKIMLEPSKLSKNDIAIAAIKIIVVFYFAIGINLNGRMQNGMTEYVLPVVTQALFGFTDIIFQATGNKNNLCYFNPNLYQQGYKFYALWDAIDCRMMHYLGMDLKMIYDLGATSQVMEYPIFNVIGGFFLAGEILVTLILLAFIILLFSFIVSFISIFMVCLITLYALIYVSPIFVPMYLLSPLKGYFNGWVRLVIACVIQPVIVVAFTSLTLTLLDQAFYKECTFTMSSHSFPNTQGFISENFNIYDITNNPSKNCSKSVGYTLLNYYNNVTGGWGKIGLILFEISFARVKWGILESSIYLIVYMLILYQFSSLIISLASDITGQALQLDKTVVGPKEMIQKLQQANKNKQK